MSNAFAPIVRARPNPIFGRPVHQGSPPFDYSPILLLKPFGFRIAPDTLSSSEETRWPTRHCPRLWIQRSSFERRRDFNPPDSCAAQRTLWRGQTSHDRTSSATAPRLPHTDQCTHVALADHEISRFPSKERPHMPVSKTTPGRLGARVIAPIRVAFRHRNDVGTQDEGTFAAQWLAYALPCQRFANTLTGTGA